MGALVKENWIDGATSTVTTDPEEVSGASSFGLQGSVTGSPSTAVSTLEGSIDGVNWAELISFNYHQPAVVDNKAAWVTGRPARYIRARVATLSGGTSPTMTVSVIAV
jgi:hypothetical protein